MDGRGTRRATGIFGLFVLALCWWALQQQTGEGETHAGSTPVEAPKATAPRVSEARNTAPAVPAASRESVHAAQRAVVVAAIERIQGFELEDWDCSAEPCIASIRSQDAGGLSLEAVVSGIAEEGLFPTQTPVHPSYGPDGDLRLMWHMGVAEVASPGEFGLNEIDDATLARMQDKITAEVLQSLEYAPEGMTAEELLAVDIDDVFFNQ